MSPDDVQLEVIDDPARWDELAPDWSRLSALAGSPARHRAWQRSWWEVYGPRYAAALRLLRVCRADLTIAWLPLYLTQPAGLARLRRWWLLSSGEDEAEETCADYLGGLFTPGEEPTALDSWADWLGANPAGDELVLDRVAADSPLIGLLERLSEHGWRTKVEPWGTCHAVDLTGGFEAMLERRSRKGRYRLRRLIRDAEESGGSLALAGPAEVRPWFAELEALHQARWTAAGQPGCFAATRFRQFHERLIAQLVPGRELVLARLASGGETRAVVYGFRHGADVELYQTGVAAASEGLLSPGMAAYVMLLRELAADGVTRVDFLAGEGPHKDRLCTETTDLVRLRAARPGPRGALAAAGRLR